MTVIKPDFATCFILTIEKIQQQIYKLMQVVSSCAEDEVRQEQLLKEFLICRQNVAARLKKEQMKRRLSLEVQNKLFEAMFQKMKVFPQGLDKLLLTRG